MEDADLPLDSRETAADITDQMSSMDIEEYSEDTLQKYEEYT